MDTIPVILDTDIGSDIDDAVALAYLLRQPRCELLGVTTVSGEPDRRAALASSICLAADREDIPVHVGIETPLLIPPRQPRAPQAEALAAGRWPHREFPLRNTAIDFLRETIRSRPGEITLLAIGPLTNIALLFALDPEIPPLLKQIVIMGGQFFADTRHGIGQSEWNILCDPHAAAMVFAAKGAPLTAVGLDVTTKCALPREECLSRFALAGGPLAPVAAMAELWFRHSPVSTFHDPLAAAVIFEPSLCEMMAGRILVELTGTHTLGQTLLTNEDDAPHRAARIVDSGRFFAHYFETVGTKNP